MDGACRGARRLTRLGPGPADPTVTGGADTVLVHHGWFWKNENPCITGPKRDRMALALQHDLNLFAYHLPLDAHPSLGNNAQLARVLGLTPERDDQGAVLTCGPEGLIWLGTAGNATTLGELGHSIGKKSKQAG